MEQSQRAPSKPEAPMLRVATWNMDHWKRTVAVREAAWGKLQELGVDVALLQETVPPRSMARDRVVYRPIGGTRGWGSGVVAPGRQGIAVEELDVVRTRYGPRLFSMLGSFPGAVVVARAAVPGLGSVTFVSVYGMIDVYAQTTMFRIVADLIPLFDSPEGQHVVLGGDFNVTTATRQNAPEFRRYAAVLHAVESLGLENLAEVVKNRPPSPVSCPCGQEVCLHLATFGGAQFDYLYATSELASRCQRLWLPTGDTADLSDHVPIVADFDLTGRLVRTQWDAGTFAALLAERHGASAAIVVENLLVWVDRKQDELRRSGYRDARLDRLPFSEGTEPQLWFQLDRRNTEGFQWTCSLRSDGNVVVQFQYMTGPFASQERRREVWERLRAIPGLNLEPRLNGRPTFPIAVLADEGRLETFLGVLDFIVDETLRASGPSASPAPVSDAEV